MKDRPVLIAVIIALVFVLTFMILRDAQATEPVPINQEKACDFTQASKEFVVFIQEKINNNPNDIARINKDFQKLANEIMFLAQEGKTDEICVKYAEFKSDLNTIRPSSIRQ